MKTKTKPKKDKYDKAIAYLKKHPRAIKHAWTNTDRHKAGCLFGFTGDWTTGCLTQVKYNKYDAPTPALTQAIRADDRIPRVADITVKSLPVFAEWQRKLDAMGVR